MKKSHIIFFIQLLILFNITLFTSCKDDDKETINTTNINTGTEANDNEIIRLETKLSSETTITNLNIVVTNENETLISNATINIGSQSFTTNENGALLLENIEVNKEFQVIKTSSSGYSNSIKTITPSSNGVTNIYITLLQPTFEASFDAENGGTVSNENISIEFPSDAIADQSGDLYDGEVHTTVTYYDPNSTTFNETTPGTLVGLDSDDTLQALISKGMIKVDLTDTSGQELEIFEGKEATITLPANTNDPETIDLWHLNEEKGIWVQTGTATKVNNEYIATVSHFSTYNLDVKVDPIDITFNLKDTNGNAIANQAIILNATHDLGFYSININTDNMGQFTIINAPKSADYNLIISDCNSILPAGIINDTTTKELSIEFSEERRIITLEGTLKECDDQILANKVFVIDITNGSTIDRVSAYTDTEGNYNITSLFCSYDTFTAYQAQIRVFDGTNDIIKDTELIFDTNSITEDIVVCNGSIEIAEERIFEGDFFINSDEKLQEFIAGGYTKITGDLVIQDIPLTDLTDFKNITYVGDRFMIDNINITDFTDLESLIFIGGSLQIRNNELLVSLEGLDNISDDSTAIFGFTIEIFNNPSLANLNVNFDNVNKLISLSISDNNKLITVDGFENTGFNEGAFIAVIADNNSLTNITFLNTVNFFAQINITSNPKLENLSGLENATNVNFLTITNNDILTDFCALNPDVISESEEFEVFGNMFNPTKNDFSDGNCSQ